MNFSSFGVASITARPTSERDTFRFVVDSQPCATQFTTKKAQSDTVTVSVHDPGLLYVNVRPTNVDVDNGGRFISLSAAPTERLSNRHRTTAALVRRLLAAAESPLRPSAGNRRTLENATVAALQSGAAAIAATVKPNNARLSTRDDRTLHEVF